MPVFSSIVDAFITKFMIKENYEKWGLLEYGTNVKPLELNVQLILKFVWRIK